MPNFDARIIGGAVIRPWPDQPAIDKPSRLNPNALYPPLVWQATPGVTVDIACVVNGVEGEVDANLGGNLFTWAWVDQPLVPAPAITIMSGLSSLARIVTPPGTEAHFSVIVRRSNGGAIIVPFDVWEPL